MKGEHMWGNLHQDAVKTVGQNIVKGHRGEPVSYNTTGRGDGGFLQKKKK